MGGFLFKYVLTFCSTCGSVKATSGFRGDGKMSKAFWEGSDPDPYMQCRTQYSDPTDIMECIWILENP